MMKRPVTLFILVKSVDARLKQKFMVRELPGGSEIIWKIPAIYENLKHHDTDEFMVKIRKYEYRIYASTASDAECCHHQSKFGESLPAEC
jgi:hypothetical protein